MRAFRQVKMLVKTINRGIFTEPVFGGMPQDRRPAAGHRGGRKMVTRRFLSSSSRTIFGWRTYSVHGFATGWFWTGLGFQN
ncbi:hypothetical protein GXY_05651 [Novacetimonas hansenii ATCC 23769]|uniref:Uncharacterized protein n=1 Tax=Novacetimonas hansenii ATCC 23769 TaxID=714995 RepID=D5QDC4_NOVHA|nr:hypothetical protein GXY_05651 [Novacetimonas hansenii ATCC 23769]